MLIPMSNCLEILRALHGLPIESILHVGTHIAEEAAAYHAAGAKKVIWFEANTALVPLILERMAQFPMQQVVMPVALFKEDCELDFNITNNFQSSSFYKFDKHADYYPEITVEEVRKTRAYRLDTLMGQQPSALPWHDFDFINIDTQGAELPILQGLGAHIGMPSLRGIYLEVNSEPIYDGIPLIGEIDAYLKAHRFSRVKTAWTKSGWGDALYVRDVEFVI